MNAPATAVLPAERAIHFRAWRVPATGEAIELDIGEPDTLKDALAEAQLGTALQHKETVLILESDAGRNRAQQHAYAVKQQSSPSVRKCPETGVPVRVRPLYLSHLFSVAVDAFEPKRRFDAFRDSAVGRDLSLVEG